MVRMVLSLFFVALGFCLATCRSTRPQPELPGVETTLDGRRVLVVGDSITIDAPRLEAPRRGFLGLGTGKNKQKNSGNITVNISHLDKSQDRSKTKIDASTVDKSEVNIKEKTDVVSKPTTTVKHKESSKSKTDDHQKTKTTQGGGLAYMGLGAAGIIVLLLILFFRKKSRE
jgi:hypothetical protein